MVALPLPRRTRRANEPARPDAPPAPTAVYVTDGCEPTFGVFHPAAGGASTTAVLMLAPFGWEDMTSYRSRREWAEQLAGAGYATLRIDLPGTGDSGGSPRDPERLEAWSQAVGSAARWLRERAGAARVAGLGIGFGGLVAAHAITTGAATFDDLALWGAPSRGRAFLRELTAFGRLEGAPTDPDADTAARTPEAREGALEAGGYLISAETATALRAIDSTAPWSRHPERALLLGRDDRPADAAVAEALTAAGCTVRVSPGPGYAAMAMAAPEDAKPPAGVGEALLEWLGETSTRRAAGSVGGGVGEAGGVAEAGGGFAAGEAGVTVEATVELSVDGVAIRERPITIDHPFGRPFGILTEPVGPTRGVRIVLLNAGPQRRTGPNRMWVELARRWAARGVPVLRMDLAGIGDAEGERDALTDPRAFYVPGYLSQTHAAVDALDALGVEGRTLAGGLCVGAYWSLQLALTDDRVDAALMVNPGSLVYDGGLTGTLRSSRAIAQKVLRLETWQRVLRRETSFLWHLRVLRALAGEALLAPARLPGRLRARRATQAAGRDDVETMFDALGARGHRALLLFAGQEAIHAEVAERGHWDRIAQWPHVSLETVSVPADVHTLRPLWLQRRAHARLDATIDRELSSDSLPAAAAREYSPAMPLTGAISSRLNVDWWSQGRLVDFYATRDIEPAEASLLLRHRNDFAGRVLELGCGAGRLTSYLAELSDHVHGIDVADTMLAHCRQAYPSVKLTHHDLRELRDFGPDAFDVVVGSCNVLDILDDAERRAILRDIHDILAPGGALMLSAHNLAYAPQLHPPSHLMRHSPRATVEHLLALPRRLRNHHHLRSHERREPGYSMLNDDAHDYGLLHYYADPEGVRAQLVEAGFTVEDVLDGAARDVARGGLAAGHVQVHYYARR